VRLRRRLARISASIGKRVDELPKTNLQNNLCMPAFCMLLKIICACLLFACYCSHRSRGAGLDVRYPGLLPKGLSARKALSYLCARRLVLVAFRDNRIQLRLGPTLSQLENRLIKYLIAVTVIADRYAFQRGHLMRRDSNCRI
jgi:hypothetical protein